MVSGERGDDKRTDHSAGDHERGVAVPRGVPGPTAAAEGGRETAPERAAGGGEATDGGLREGDTGLGRVVAAPTASAELTEADLKAMGEADEAALADAFESAASQGLRLPGFLFSATFVLAVAALGSVLVLFVLTQVAALIGHLEAVSEPLRTIGYGAIGVLLLVVVLAGLRLLWVWLRLGRTRQLDVATVSALAERRGIRRLAHARMGEGVTRLRTYLETFPLGEGKETEALERFGFKPGDVERLRADRKQLLDDDRHPGHAEWLLLFAGSFQRVLDSAARRRTLRAAKLVALKTAATPRSVDTIIVLHAALQLVGDLASIYRLRLGALGTAVVLSRAFTFAYLSSHVEQLAEGLTSDAASEGAAQLLGGLPDGIGDMGSQVAGVVAPKVAEGAANGIMLFRLGVATTRMLRPVTAA